MTWKLTKHIHILGLAGSLGAVRIWSHSNLQCCLGTPTLNKVSGPNFMEDCYHFSVNVSIVIGFSWWLTAAFFSTLSIYGMEFFLEAFEMWGHFLNNFITGRRLGVTKLNKKREKLGTAVNTLQTVRLVQDVITFHILFYRRRKSTRSHSLQQDQRGYLNLNWCLRSLRNNFHWRDYEELNALHIVGPFICRIPLLCSSLRKICLISVCDGPNEALRQYDPKVMEAKCFALLIMMSKYGHLKKVNSESDISQSLDKFFSLQDAGIGNFEVENERSKK